MFKKKHAILQADTVSEVLQWLTVDLLHPNE
jgi:hypothetical protein